MAAIGEAYIPIVNAEHSTPTTSKRMPPCRAKSVTKTTTAKNPMFTAATNFIIFS